MAIDTEKVIDEIIRLERREYYENRHSVTERGKKIREIIERHAQTSEEGHDS